MNNENGFIVLHRKMLEWEWYSDPKTVTVWLYLLLKANWKPNRWRGIDIERGQTLETIAGIAKATGLSVRSVRTALEHLKSTNEVTTKSTGYGTLISITQYSKYQDLPDDIDKPIDKRIDKSPTNDRQTTDNTRTNITKKQSNNIVCEEYISNTESNQKPSFPPTLADIELFVSENDLVVDPKYFFDYYESAGWEPDWKARLRRWDKEDREKQSQPPKQQTANVVPMPSYMQEQKEQMLQKDEPKEKKRIVIDDWENLW
ncbi:MAG: hypothetical protein IKE92_11870 [Clostridiales bacterium]|nr:hypothetical protein [Clostridiales bacterium]